MREPTPQTIFLKDYAPPAFLIPETALAIAIFEDHARVRATLKIERNPATPAQDAPLELDGEELQLESVALDGRVLGGGEFEAGATRLTIPGVPGRFTLETSVRIEPRKNTQFMGLYASKAGY